MQDDKRNEILQKLADGELTLDEADHLLESVESASEYAEGNAAETRGGETDEFMPETKTSPISPEFKKFKWVWVWVLTSGIILTLLGAFGMYSGYENHGMRWGFWLSWIPLLLGVAVTTIALATSNAVWLHVRVNTGQNEWPRRIVISLPLPMFLLRFGMRMGKLDLDGVGKFGVNDVDALLKAIQESDVPLTVHVDEGGGEKVEVYIGK